MARRCYLCKTTQSNKESDVRLHTFPKDEALRPLWIKACGLSDSDNLTNVKICSKHFRPEDYNLQTKYLLKDTVPTVKVKVLVLPVVQYPSTPAPTETFADVKQEDGTTPKKRRFADPRYISEITVDDVSTPGSARRVIQFVKKTVEKKNKTIKSLQDANRSLRKRISALENTIVKLHEKGLISAEADQLVKIVPENMRAIVLKKSTKWYSQEMRIAAHQHLAQMGSEAASGNTDDASLSDSEKSSCISNSLLEESKDDSSSNLASSSCRNPIVNEIKLEPLEEIEEQKCDLTFSEYILSEPDTQMLNVPKIEIKEEEML